MAIAISNEPRECGVKQDGWYLSGSAMSPRGRLLPLVWILGDMVLGTDTNLLWQVPERSLHYIDGEQSLDRVLWIEHRVGCLGRANGEYPGSHQLQLELLKHSTNEPLCLLKHIGRKFYTPATKAIELVRRGPSERMPKDVVITIAPLLRMGPVKLFYTSSQIVHFITMGDRDRCMDYVMAEQVDEASLALQTYWSFDNDESKMLLDPTWTYPNWRWKMIKSGEELIFPNNGSQHWWVKVLSYAHRHPDIGIDGSVMREAVFAGTHITQAQRVIRYETAQELTGKREVVPHTLDDSQFAPLSALDAGVQVSILPPEGETQWR